ncbi:MAG: sigma-70 family RNA polymerase sigma factor [Cytophagaceae bacterium]|nr:sigma-70 family RNA polymerase sigma factor [Cytophagaceae bacterium]MDW8456335.1 sigma-70 family RNA polymerase sigma factor [Cytophagaceae bacterium]
MKKYNSDEEIIQGIQADDVEALRVLYRRNYHSIVHFVYNNNGDEHDAKDIFQEGILIVYEKLKSDSFQLSCSLRTYLYSVCRKLWLKKLNQRSRYIGKIEDYDEVISLEEDESYFNEETDYQNIKHSLLMLGEPCKTIIEDFYIHRLSMADIAEKFGYTNADNAKNQKYKCLNRLKKIFFSLKDKKVETKTV